MRLKLICTILVTFTGISRCFALTPLGQGFTYQGQLKQNGQGVSGSVSAVFDLYDDPNAGILLGSQTVNPLMVTNGLFTIALNDANQFGSNPFSGQAMWLAITINGQLLAPRQQLTATPYAAYALKAANGHALDAADGSPANAVFVDNAGKVGIGTTTPAKSLDIVSTGSGDGVRVTGFTSGFKSPGYLLFDGPNARGALGLAEIPGAWSTEAETGDVVLRADTGKLLLQSGGGISALVVTAESSNCCFQNGGAGCDDPTCQAAVCAGDPFCCNFIWDGNCVDDAEILCSSCSDKARVGIGTTSPTNKLSVAGNADFTGNVGIGTTSPTAKLDVRGNISTTGSITLPTTTRFVSFSPYAFHPTNTSFVYAASFLSGALWARGTQASQNIELAAAVHLPQGAVVTRFSALVFDSDSTANITVELDANFVDNGTGAAMGSVISSGTPGQTLLVDTVISNATIDNFAKAYWVRANWLNQVNDALRLGSVRIEYTVTSPLP